MRRIAAAAAVALLLSALAGTARAGGTWVVVPTSLTPPTMTASLPSADTASLSGTLPLGWTSPPAIPQQLPYPELVSVWQRAGATYGIPWQVLAAINKVESNFGRNMGPSSAGAIGWMQFMPDTWLRWGTDANGDGVADPWNAEDAIFSAARYLAAAGGTQDIPRAIFAYNHAQWYVDEVLQLSTLFTNAGVDATFTIDQMSASLQQARSDVAAASGQVMNAQQDTRRLAHRSDALQVRADHATLLSTRIDLQRLATLAQVAADAAAARAKRAQQELATARAQLDRVRSQSRAASFAPGAATLLDAPQYQGGYVFPVGGGASIVSVSHTHHDYPAADIAAPEGTPVYALADAVVERAWTVPDPACGLGITILTADGLTWTYCHLSFIYPNVQAGVTLSAGAPVGLVGSTGDASGPHLHLQTQPASLWPQQMAWFQGFAGSAFRWQDAATPAPAPRVFALVDEANPVIGFTP
jgi:murein DD-endopeptidase MepM/ murein hydrolase activator NlpD